MATHSSILAWKIPRAEEPGRLESVGSQRVGHDRVTNTCGRQKNASQDVLTPGLYEDIGSQSQENSGSKSADLHIGVSPVQSQKSY